MAAKPENRPFLEMTGICKRFGQVRAADNVSLTLYPGDVLGLLGENGAGKTTLMNVLFGVYAADSGEIRVDGRPATVKSSADALELGIGMVHQHFHLVPCHTVLENLMVGRKGIRGFRLDRSGVLEKMRKIESLYGLTLDPNVLVSDLTIGQQQRLEILKALIGGARILILDEPTATLTPQEADGLFEAIRAMIAKGMAVIFISHKLHEVLAVTNRIMILRRGKAVAAIINDESTSKGSLASLMCDEEIGKPPDRAPADPGRPLLALDGINTGEETRRGLKSVTLTVHAGEIVGIAAVAGNGQGDLAEVVAGTRRPVSGKIAVDGREVTRVTPEKMKSLGVGRIPEDRMGTGLITTLPLKNSMVLPRIKDRRFSRFGILKPKSVNAFVQKRMAEFDIRAAGPDARCGTLSGGNLQKALLARELAWNPLVLLAAQPTRGLDFAAAGFVHRQFFDLRARGRGVLVISEDLEELFTLSDRIAVMFEGKIMGILPISEATVKGVGLLMAGVREAA